MLPQTGDVGASPESVVAPAGVGRIADGRQPHLSAPGRLFLADHRSMFW